MMTTMAALMGTLPIALGLGAGAESRRPLGLAVVGGLLFSQILTLFVTPVFYVYMDAFAGAQRRPPEEGRSSGRRAGALPRAGAEPLEFHLSGAFDAARDKRPYIVSGSPCSRR